MIYLLFLMWLFPFMESYAMSLSAQQKAFFEEHGYLGPLFLFSPEEAEALGEEIDRQMQSVPVLITSPPHPNATSLLSSQFDRDFPSAYGQPCYWHKSTHLFLPKVATIGQSEGFLCFLTELLGPDILLWGAKLVKKAPGQSHRWHVDIEHTGWDGLTFWLPLSNVSSKSTIKFIPGSHHFDQIPQSLGSKVNLEDDQSLLKAICKQHPNARVVSMDIQPGQFVLFAGRIWHSTVNQTKSTRKALLFQYCRPDARVRVPLNFELPTLWAPDQPWVLQIAGEDRYGINYVYPHD